MFPQAIANIAWDITERLFFAASSDGSIYQVNLFKQREDSNKEHIHEAVGGGGVSDVIRVSEDRLITVGSDFVFLLKLYV